MHTGRLDGAEVTVCGDNVVCLFFLSKLVTIVLGLSFCGFANQRRSNQTSMHSREKRSTEYPSNTEHVERVHKDIVFCLEYKHIVKSTRDTKRHSIGETTLSERINEEDCRSSSDRCAVGNADPGAHTQTVGEFPLTSHIGIDADQEVEDYELERYHHYTVHSSRDALPRWDRSEVQLPLEEGTTAPEMMLFPYMSEPATGSRMPSMSTGGAAMKATMKQIVAANRVGIIRTPNQPT